MESNLLKIFYFRITDVWKLHCELHSELFDLTCDEYALLLDSDIEDLEKKITQKNALLGIIKKNDIERELILEELRANNKGMAFDKISDVIEYFSDFPAEKESKHLWRFNQLLIDIVNKIQDQNKKNQLFISKAINSLRVIREEASGTKTVSTYNSQGMRQNRTLANSI